MSTEHETCPFSEDLAAYVLGSLDPDAEGRVATHLEDCERCAAELRWLRPALETLPESVEQISPPPELRERVMETVRADAEREAPRRKLAWREWRLPIGRFAFGPATALAALLIAVAAGIGYGIGDGGGGESRTVAVAAEPPGSAARIEISDDAATLLVSGAPQLPAGSVYQVWVREGGEVEPSASFRPNRNGSAAAAIPELLGGGEGVMVTREPGPDSPAPSSAPIYSATTRS